MANAFLTAIEQQMRLQYGCFSLREPTHWIMTMFCPFAGQVLSVNRFSSSTWVRTRSDLPYKNSVVLAACAPVATMMAPPETSKFAPPLAPPVEYAGSSAPACSLAGLFRGASVTANLPM